MNDETMVASIRFYDRPSGRTNIDRVQNVRKVRAVEGRHKALLQDGAPTAIKVFAVPQAPEQA